MKIINCVRCKQAFAMVNNTPVCGECLKKEEEQFDLIKVYLDENRGATMEQIAEDTGVPVKRILQFLKDGRLEGVQGSGLKCSRCGIEITKGKYCPKCDAQLKKSLDALQQGMEVETIFQERAKVSLMTSKDRH